MKRVIFLCLAFFCTAFTAGAEDRNLNEVTELVELEAGVSARNFDLIAYFRFLEKYGMVEFVK